MNKNKTKSIRSHRLLARIVDRDRWTEGVGGEKIFNFSKWVLVTEDLNLGSAKYPNHEVLEIRWEPIEDHSQSENPLARFGRW